MVGRFTSSIISVAVVLSVSAGCAPQQTSTPKRTVYSTVVVEETVPAGHHVRPTADTAVIAPPAVQTPLGEETSLPVQELAAPWNDSADSESLTSQLNSILGAQAGIAILPVGGAQPVTAGDWEQGVAWSTIKVPLAMAALKAVPSSYNNATSAITISNNEAAGALWSSLGSPEQAAAAVQAQLALLGDTQTLVPSQRLRPPYSIFGQTQWTLKDQVGAFSRLPCTADAQMVLDMMSSIDPSQSWGLGALAGAQYKGGWGPMETGGYMVRQAGIIPASGGKIAIAVAAEADSFPAATARLTQIANGIAPLLAELPAGNC